METALHNLGLLALMGHTTGNRDDAISEKKPVTIGLILTVCGMLCGLIGLIGGGLWTAAWWGSATTTRLQSIQDSLTSINVKVIRLDDLDMRLSIVEKAGSPKAIELDRSIQELRRLIEMHIASETKKGTQ